MPYQTHGLRHDTDHLFALLLREEMWANTPCVVIRSEEICIARSIGVLLAFDNSDQVICGWPGKQRQDVFEFTVGAFREYVNRSSGHRPATAENIGGEKPMTCVDPKTCEGTEEKQPETQDRPIGAGQEAEPKQEEPSDAGGESEKVAE